MIWIQRVWLALLLAIAGGGPLPLWLHHMQCHCSSSDCGPESLGCTHHGHSHHSHSAHLHAYAQAGKQHVAPAMRDVGSDHEDCAACYCLSQLSVSAAIRPLVSSESSVLLRAGSPDQIPEFDLLAAYSSRAPPAV